MLMYIFFAVIKTIYIYIYLGGQIYPTLIALSPIPTLHLPRFKASSFSNPTLLLSFSTSIVHVFFGRPCFLLPFTSNFNAFLRSKHAHHPSSTHAHTISLHSPLSSETRFPSIPTSPLGPLSSFSPSVLHHKYIHYIIFI